MRNGALQMVTFILAMLLFISPVYGVAIGVNRASISFQDVLRGGFAREIIMVTTDSEVPITAEVLITGEGEEWLSFSARNFTFSKDAPYALQIDIEPPQDARIETYRINMSILTGEITRSEGGQLGTTTRASLGVPILLHMTGTERAACSVAGLVVRDTETERPLDILLSVHNTGNVRINPRVEIEVLDKLRVQTMGKATIPFGESVRPTLTSQRTLSEDMDLQYGQYWMTVRVPECGFTDMQTFDVLLPGGIKDDGELIRVEAPSWAETGDILRIAAVFRNKGTRPVRAVFKGTIVPAGEDRIVKVIETDEYLVDPDVTAEIETFFNPLEPARYEVVGKVYYNEKITVEKGAIINVNGPFLDMLGTVPWKGILLFLFLVAILAMLILIKRRKQRRRRIPPGWAGHQPRR